jgi:hypothetical protein
VAAELRQLRGAPLARRYFELAMAQGDPRYVGYAEAALRNAENDPPAEVLFVRGLLKQYRHDFNGALADLEGRGKARPRPRRRAGLAAAIFMVRRGIRCGARRMPRAGAARERPAGRGLPRDGRRRDRQGARGL